MVCKVLAPLPGVHPARRVECRFPGGLQLDALLLTEHVVLVKVAALAEIAWVLEISGVKLPPTSRSATVAAHHLMTTARPWAQAPSSSGRPRKSEPPGAGPSQSS